MHVNIIINRGIYIIIGHVYICQQAPPIATRKKQNTEQSETNKKLMVPTFFVNGQSNNLYLYKLKKKK